MNRRTFIIVGSAAFGAAAVSYYVTASDDGTSSALALILEPETILEIGKKYRESNPDEDSRQKLSDLLSPLEGKDVELIVKEDFVAGRTIQIDGWIISLTEARQCALASLTS